ncbi:hypothetical protein LIER_29509 [Lithospermum erythrorhizon]|uniref:DUF4283 domain-containing protein n=1 Tax=Lithospermum erythrorhizon TaxID=34254 RepID=A0AAV3RGY0_LITER
MAGDETEPPPLHARMVVRTLTLLNLLLRNPYTTQAKTLFCTIKCRMGPLRPESSYPSSSHNISNSSCPNPNLNPIKSHVKPSLPNSMAGDINHVPHPNIISSMFKISPTKNPLISLSNNPYISHPLVHQPRPNDATTNPTEPIIAASNNTIPLALKSTSTNFENKNINKNNTPIPCHVETAPTSPKRSYALTTIGLALSSSKVGYECSNIGDLRPVTTHKGKPSVVFKRSDKHRHLSMMKHVLVELNWARPLCVELNIFKPLMDATWISFVADENPNIVDGFWQSVEYDDVPHYCSKCFYMGHKVEDCKRDFEKEKGQGPKAPIVQHRRPYHRVVNPMKLV